MGREEVNILNTEAEEVRQALFNLIVELDLVAVEEFPHHSGVYSAEKKEGDASLLTCLTETSDILRKLGWLITLVRDEVRMTGSIALRYYLRLARLSTSMVGNVFEEKKGLTHEVKVILLEKHSLLGKNKILMEIYSRGKANELLMEKQVRTVSQFSGTYNTKYRANITQARHHSKKRRRKIMRLMSSHVCLAATIGILCSLAILLAGLYARDSP